MKDFRPCLKGLLRSLALVRGRVLLTSLIYLVGAAASLAFVWYSRQTVDVATGKTDGDLGLAVGLLVLFMILKVSSRIASRWCEGAVTVDAKIRIRKSAFDKALRSSWDGQERFHSADVVNRLEEDIRVVSDFVCVTLPAFLVTVFQLVAAVAMLFVMSSSLAWILVWIMPVAVVAARLFFRRLRALTSEIRTVDARIQGHMQEHLQHRVLVKTLGNVDDVEDELDGLQGRERVKTIERLNYSTVSHAFMHIGFSTGFLVTFLWAVFGLKDGAITYGLMAALLQMVGQVQTPVANLASYIPAFIRALSSQERLLEIEELRQEAKTEDVMIPGAPGVKIENLQFSYSPVGSDRGTVIQNLCCDFKPGEMVAICGPTGKGKSTLAQLILGLLSPDSGSITLYGEDGSFVPAGPSARCNFMYVPQGNSLLSGTVRKNLLMADPSADEEKIRRALLAADAAFIYDLPDGLDTECSEAGHGLSEGQAQRVAIARALLHSGGILILDEATSALDMETEARVLSGIREMCGSNKTILCITHRQAAAGISDLTFNL